MWTAHTTLPALGFCTRVTRRLFAHQGPLPNAIKHANMCRSYAILECDYIWHGCNKRLCAYISQILTKQHCWEREKYLSWQQIFCLRRKRISQILITFINFVKSNTFSVTVFQFFIHWTIEDNTPSGPCLEWRHEITTESTCSKKGWTKCIQ